MVRGVPSFTITSLLEREIWEVTHVTEEDFETNEGEVEDLYDKLMEQDGGRKVKDNEKLFHDKLIN